MPHKPVIISIGYEGRASTDFLRALKELNVSKVVDVRQLAFSRKRGFSRAALASSLQSAGIEYCHVPSAGNPYRKQSKNVTRCLSLYRAYIQRNPQIIKTVASELDCPCIAFLCFERLHENCHRSVLIDAMCERAQQFDIIRVD